mmetsp:Transcript_30346/g.41579  ORF Transcript_30346/g.41579 Transcript_30346/m.41579 type:complete len:187 (-) Transcript_30346:246-806(-)|eukprot:CAMPEP_0170072836 /NCGR_PEP_ID=MMETSP0019_2-20121128/10389_1 /TAXON_ID=98059 /ORGANISM="Dinobryon sp., Strain UTEXLB2267" /LENGTH=186 /DNA_ID=CAMNT_0010282035 /DNA_START=46 /DNA_END=606 /DNA_ORIENTATION=-
MQKVIYLLYGLALVISFASAILTKSKCLKSSVAVLNESKFEKSQSLTSLHFKRKTDDDNESERQQSIAETVWKGISRFVPGITRAKIEKSYEIPQVEGGYRYHIRLANTNANNRRHVITRILRYFTDIKWETAADIVDTSIVDGKALIRVLNSLQEATYLADMLRKADPPIEVEVYDSKKDEIVMI